MLGTRPVADIRLIELLDCVRKIEARGFVETAHRTLNICRRVFTYAISTDRIHLNPIPSRPEALASPKRRNHAGIREPSKIAALLRAIEGYNGSTVTRHALRLAALTFVRPGELRKAEWTEIDLDKREWHISAGRMKKRIKHIVPLSMQSIAILESLRQNTGTGKFLFPGVRDRNRPMSENTINAALRNMGYHNDEMTGHGFRGMASTILNEKQYFFDAIERQLAHADRNSVRAAYNYAEHLPARTEMMQDWANYLDSLHKFSDC